MTPHRSVAASASAARMQERISSVVQHQFADPLLGMRQVGVAERLRHQQRDAEHELAFGEVLGGALMRRMRRRVGARAASVEPVDIVEQEHPLPRHQDVVEEHDAIHLLEARAQRMVEMRAAQIEAVAAEEFEPRRAARDREIDRERAVVLAVPRQARRIDRDLVGQAAPVSRGCGRRFTTMPALVSLMTRGRCPPPG